MLIWTAKDPDEVLDYSWQPPLDSGDSIASFTASVAEGDVVIDSSSDDDTTITLWLSGGTEDSQILIRATTAGGRTFEETIALPIRASGSDFSAALKAAFPDFAAVPQATIDFWAERAGRVITDAYGDDRQYATMLLTAHYLVMQGLGTGVDAQRWSNFAGANRVKSGSLELGWSEGKQTSGSRYGDEVLGLIRAYTGGPSVTGTGYVPCGSGFNGWAGPLPPYGRC